MNDSNEVFSEKLYKSMQSIAPAIMDLELYEFRYALENIIPVNGWHSVQLLDSFQIEKLINTREFYESIQLKLRHNGKLVIDPHILHLTQMLFKGLVEKKYSEGWILQHFYFDVRGFLFFHRTQYNNPSKSLWLGELPFKSFEVKQETLKRFQSIGYPKFKQANAEVDTCFVEILQMFVQSNNKPCVIGIAGQTAAGKTEIVSRIQEDFKKLNLSFTSLEIDHFLTDRDLREEKGIDSLGKEALHFEMFISALQDLRTGKNIFIPQYDFISATSSHTEGGLLKPDRTMGEILPADIIFIEGNFPFLYPEVAELIDLKVVYLTDDEIRLKRKWKRDMDYRKKYEITYFLNRYFREQFLMAESAYIPQIGNCDLLVDTTKAQIWLTTKLKKEVEKRILKNPQ